MKKLLVAVAVIASALLLLRVFPAPVHQATAQEIYVGMAAGYPMIKTIKAIKSPNADRPPDPSGSHVTYGRIYPPEGTPPPTPTPHR